MATDGKAILNTTIDEDVLNNFRNYCKIRGIQMNTVIEAFMRQFTLGEVVIKLGKDNLAVDID